MSMMYAKVDTIMKPSELPTKSKLSTSSLPEEDSDPFPYEDEEDSLDVSGQKRVTFNVGGVIFETLESSLTQPKRIVAKLLDHRFLERHWDEERREYFFDRDPVAFQAVLNYLRTGVLHLPHNMCSPQITAELIYWGLPRIDIEPCCWKDYSIGIQSLENLRKLEHDRQPAYTNPANLAHRPKPQNWHQRLKIRVWNVVSDPSSSRVAKMYSFISMLLVMVSIISFTLRSLPSVSGRVGDWSYTEASLRELHSSHFSRTLTYLYVVDFFCLSFFVLELSTILLSCPDPNRLLRSAQGVIEVTAVVPDMFNLLLLLLSLREDEATVVSDVRIGQSFLVCRTLRLFRLFRLVRRVPTLMIIVYSMWASMKDLVSVLLVVIIASIFFSSLMYYLDDRAVFKSIPHGCWWGIVTMTTVGYGDMVPQTGYGKVVGACCAVSGVLVLGISAPTLVHNFVSYLYLFRFMAEREALFIRKMRERDEQKGQTLLFIDK